MDILRGFAIVLVILFHSATVLRRLDIEPSAWLLAWNKGFALFRMPALMFLSGLLLPASMRKGTPVYLIGKVRRILWPLILWTVIYTLVVEGVSGGAVGLFWRFAGGSYLWFLAFIFAFYLVAIPVKRVPYIVVSAAALALAIWSPDGGKYTERLFYLMAFFFAGAYAGSHWQTLIAAITSRWVWALAPIVLLFAGGAVAFKLGYGPDMWLPAACFILVASALAYRFQDVALLRPIAAVGRNSLIYYVLHFPLIYLVIVAGSSLGVRSPMLLSFGSFVMVAVVGSLLVIGARRYRLVELLFVGPDLPTSWKRRIAQHSAATDQISGGRADLS